MCGIRRGDILLKKYKRKAMMRKLINPNARNNEHLNAHSARHIFFIKVWIHVVHVTNLMK